MAAKQTKPVAYRITDYIVNGIKDKLAHILMTIVGLLLITVILYFIRWAKMPDDMTTLKKDVRINDSVNRADHKVFYMKFDSVNKTRVSREDWQKGQQELLLDMKIIMVGLGLKKDTAIFNEE